MITRDHEHAVLGGVCGGLAKHMEIDPLILRLLFVFAFLFYGTGVLLYLVMLLVMPQD